MIKPSEMAKPRLFEGKQTEPRIKASSSDNDILLAAMTAERKSEEYYNKMSERIKDSKGKTFFKTLAEFEKVHYNTIRELIK
jgi:rubrerythrin